MMNGDRRILRDVTKNKIQNIEQNSRTTPLGSTKTKRGFTPLFCFGGLAAGEHPRRVNDDANRGSHFASKAMGACSQSPRAKIFAEGETPRNIKVMKGDRSFLRDATKNQIQSIEQKARTTTREDTILIIQPHNLQ